MDPDAADLHLGFCYDCVVMFKQGARRGTQINFACVTVPQLMVPGPVPVFCPVSVCMEHVQVQSNKTRSSGIIPATLGTPRVTPPNGGVS